MPNNRTPLYALSFGLTTYINSSSFKRSEDYKPDPLIIIDTAGTATFVKMGIYALERIFKGGYEYQKAGVMLFDIAPDTYQQLCLFQAEKYNHKSRKRMKLLDHINNKCGS